MLADFTSHVGDPGHDTLQLSGYAGITDLNSLIAATDFNGGNALITVETGNTIKIPGLTQSMMTANPGSFAFS